VDVSDVTVPVKLEYDKYNIPNIKFKTICNIYKSIFQFGYEWRKLYLRTDYAFDTFSKYASKVLMDNVSKYDLILQSGLLFRIDGKKYNSPYVLGILDNTYLIGKKGHRRPVTTANLSQNFIVNETMAYKEANIIFVMSNHVKNSLIEDYGVDGNKVIITGVGPNVEPESNYIIDNNKYYSKKITMIGIDFERKGGEILLEAFKILKSRCNNYELSIIGPSLESNISGVCFKGMMSKKDIQKELKETNLLVLPSQREPFGIALIEAMAFGTPCIGTDIEAIPEIIDDGRTGYVVPFGNIDILAKRMEDILSNSILAKSMGNAGREKYNKRYCWNVIGDLIEKSLENILIR
jgi:glycosyltransferase involved in cell wall biosynthesis